MTDELSRTLVDLPGLVHVAITEQGEKDKQLIFNLVKAYMQNPRTIILAVVSAESDRDNQVILADCKRSTLVVAVPWAISPSLMRSLSETYRTGLN
jgi:uncharacterized membrane protein (UPF0182 family)